MAAWSSRANASTLTCDVHSNPKESDPGPYHPTPSGISTCPAGLMTKEPAMIVPCTADISVHAPQPESQTHATLAAVELECAGHNMHVEFAVAPTTAEYVPALQSLHAWLPCTALYLPATHCTQVPPSGPHEPRLQLQFVTALLPAAELEFVGHA